MSNLRFAGVYEVGVDADSALSSKASMIHFMSCLLFCFFFFQAEDGIRDYKVTGVQTCALPIWYRFAFEFVFLRFLWTQGLRCSQCGCYVVTMQTGHSKKRGSRDPPVFLNYATEIGRASCRERV